LRQSSQHGAAAFVFERAMNPVAGSTQDTSEDDHWNLANPVSDHQ